MTDDGDFLRRWARRKAASKAGTSGPTADAAPAKAGAQLPEPAKTAPQEAAPLPPVESLTFESDFTPFMKPDVDAGLKRQALKTLLRDPRFNVMDGLDVYIDDYSKPDPLPDEWLGQLNQMKRLGEYVEPDAEAEKNADEETTTTEKAMQEQPVAFPENESPADTTSEQSPPPESGNEGS